MMVRPSSVVFCNSLTDSCILDISVIVAVISPSPVDSKPDATQGDSSTWTHTDGRI